MAIIPAILIFLALLVLTAGVVFSVSKNGVSGFKLMLLGINITLIGGILAVDPDSSLGGCEYLIVFLGLAISAIGLGKKD